MGVIELVESTRKSIEMTRETALKLVELGTTFVLPETDLQDREESTMESQSRARRSVIECYPDVSSDGHWVVTVRNHIGVIKVDDQTLIIKPKIALEHFTYIASQGLSKYKLDDSRVKISEGNSLLDLIASWFVEACNKLIPKDLRNAYSPRNESLFFIRGRPALMRSSINWMSGNLETECDFEEFEINNPLNRILKWGLIRVANMTTLHADIRRSATGLSKVLADVGEIQADDFQVRISRETSHYEEPINLAQMIRNGTGRDLNTGVSSTSAFLQYSPSIIEQGIRTMLARSMDDFVVEKGFRKLGIGSANPDLLFRKGSELATGDVKYVTNDDGWSKFRNPAQQAVFFAAAFETYRSLVIAFSTCNKNIETEVVGRHKVSLISWNTDSSVSPEDSKRTLLQDLRSVLEAVG